MNALKAQILVLPRKLQMELLSWLLTALSESGTANQVRQNPNSQESQTVRVQRFIKCGKKGCACSDGMRHGPYWYSRQWDGHRTRWRYIGKELPTEKP